jgi:hypothetical protein
MVVAEFGPLLAVLAAGGGLVLAGCALSAVVAVRPPQVVGAIAGGLPPREHAVSRFHVRWYPVTCAGPALLLGVLGDVVLPLSVGSPLV